MMLRHRKLAAVVGVLVVVVFAGAALVWVSDWRNAVLEDHRQLSSQLSEVQDRVARLENELQMTRQHLTLHVDVPEAARLSPEAFAMERLTEAAVAADVDLRSLVELGQRSWEGLELATTRLEAEGTYDRVIELLVEIERSEPAFIASRAVFRRLPDLQDDALQPRLLVHLDLGLIAQGEAEQ